MSIARLSDAGRQWLASIKAVLAGTLLCVAAACAAQTPAARLDKKLIEFGWDIPYPDYVRTNIRKMEERPFDGIIFRLRGGSTVLTPQAWAEEKFAEDFEHLSQIEWRKFTDNFILMWSASDQDWFNDEHWQAIEHNVRVIARAARLARCAGVCFDPEPYGTNPWDYRAAAHAGVKSFAEYEKMARQRGRQFVRAVRSEFPDPKIFTLYQVYPFSRILDAVYGTSGAEQLSEHHDALMPAFLNGMLEEGGSQVTIIDGNEQAYYFTELKQYLASYHLMKQLGLQLIAPELRDLYRSQFRAGQALYVDQYFALRKRKTYGNYMTPVERARWFEHNVYWALYTTDEYCWCYSERMNWWSGDRVPEGCEDAIRAARRKLEQGEELGFELAPIIAAAKDKQQQEQRARLQPRSARVARLAAETVPPTIDGRLDDPAWETATRLAPFVPLAAAAERSVAETRARLSCDDRALYIAFDCAEPDPAGLNAVGTQRDDPIWKGDGVEILISLPGQTFPLYHFMVNPKGLFWDSIYDGKREDTSYDPAWKCAARVGDSGWTVEAAMPWAEMKMEAPQSGHQLRANLCRQRAQGGELTSWCPMAEGFREAENFGTWRF